jgi:hypothetical protein
MVPPESSAQVDSAPADTATAFASGAGAEASTPEPSLSGAPLSAVASLPGGPLSVVASAGAPLPLPDRDPEDELDPLRDCPELPDDEPPSGDNVADVAVPASLGLAPVEPELPQARASDGATPTTNAAPRFNAPTTSADKYPDRACRPRRLFVPAVALSCPTRESRPPGRRGRSARRGHLEPSFEHLDDRDVQDLGAGAVGLVLVERDDPVVSGKPSSLIVA